MSQLLTTRWMLFAVLVAVMVRALIPLGYMPDIKGAKHFQMVICSLDGPRTVTVDESFNPVGSSEKPDHNAKERCDFALLQHSPALDAAIHHVMFTVPVPTGESVERTDHQLPQTIVACRLAQPRAPPVFS
jgi:hypothetical protein